jgi:hypothetical protein
MNQLFPRYSNNLSRFSIIGGLTFLAFIIWMADETYDSDYVTDVNTPIDQPIQFSHKHHVGDDGIDCRYCHASVTISSFAGIPSTETCMTCHSELWQQSPILAPVRSSYQTNAPLRWKRVHNLPKYVYFDHSIHINKGIGCSTCHGRVDQMPLVWKVATLRMEWCLECHRAPEKNIRDRDQIFNMEWTPSKDQVLNGKRLAKRYGVASTQRITDCFTCHR